MSDEASVLAFRTWLRAWDSVEWLPGSRSGRRGGDLGHARAGAGALRNLVQKRASAVADELVCLGIDRNRITLKSNSQSDRPFAAVYPADRPEQYVPGSRS
jgi:hypothetical protein